MATTVHAADLNDTGITGCSGDTSLATTGVEADSSGSRLRQKPQNMPPLGYNKEHPMLTKVFQSDNFLAVRIPKEMTFDGNVQEVDIVRKGDPCRN